VTYIVWGLGGGVSAAAAAASTAAAEASRRGVSSSGVVDSTVAVSDRTLRRAPTSNLEGEPQHPTAIRDGLELRRCFFARDV